MPRIHPSLFWRARRLDKQLLPLLPICRDIRASQNELRWMTEQAVHVSDQLGLDDHRGVLRDFIARRAQGQPLQYLLGSEYFGDLEIRCRRGVLIPRQETAASTVYLADRLRNQSRSLRNLRVLDLCTGTGCIPLLFHHEFYREANQTALELMGVDISSDALSLARENLIHQIAAQRDSVGNDNPLRTQSLVSIGFVQADVMAKENDETQDKPMPVIMALQRLMSDDQAKSFDVLISNPPYISPEGFRRTTTRSVRLFEPQLALVPQRTPGISDIEIGDTFYPRLIRLANQLQVKVMLLEVADLAQAKRVAALMAQEGTWNVIEIWRDEPGRAVEGAQETLDICGRAVNVKGVGNGRSVYASKWQSSVQR